MQIPGLSRRTQLLLDEERYRRLERQAQATHSSIAAVVWTAIDIAYPARDVAGLQAVTA